MCGIHCNPTCTMRQEVAFRQAIPYFSDVVLLYDSNVAIFGEEARMVTRLSVDCTKRIDRVFTIRNE